MLLDIINELTPWTQNHEGREPVQVTIVGTSFCRMKLDKNPVKVALRWTKGECVTHVRFAYVSKKKWNIEVPYQTSRILGLMMYLLMQNLKFKRLFGNTQFYKETMGDLVREERLDQKGCREIVTKYMKNGPTRFRRVKFLVR